MSFYAGKPEWHESIYEVEIVDPVLGGSVSWRGDYPSSGYSNAAAQQLADRTVFLRNRVEEILGDIEEGVMARVEHQETDSIEFVGDGRRGSPLRANLKESLDTIAWVRKDNTFTKGNFFRGVTEVEDPTGARGAVNKRTLDFGLAPKADKTYVDTELAKKQDNLVAGANIQINQSTNVISATDTRYTAGNGLTLSGTVFSLPVTKSGTGTFVKSVDQNTNGITVTLDTPPDTTYNPVTTTTDGLMTSADKVKLNGIATGATKNATDAQLRNRTTHTGEQPISSVTGLQTALDGKVENDDPRMANSREWTASVVSQAEAETGTATTARKWTAQRVRQAILGWWSSSAEKTKLDGIATGATKNATDAQLRDRTTHTGVQPISSVDGLQTALDSKVNEGDARLTNAREWTASIVTQAEAEAGTATSARKWTSQRVRQAIESWWGSTNNQTKLDGIQVGATKNATDAELRNRATHTGTQAISTVSGLQTALDSKVDNTDSRLTNSREWTGATISQAEAEAGIATTRRAFTAQRVRQAIEAWWLTIGTAFGKGLLNASDANSAKSSLGLHSVASSGNYNELSNRPASMSQAEANAGTATTARLITPKVLVDTISNAVSGGVSADALIKANNLSDLPNKTTARNNLGLGNAATRNVGESSGNLMEVGAFGLGANGLPSSGIASLEDPVGFYADSTTGEVSINVQRNKTYGFKLFSDSHSDHLGFVAYGNGIASPTRTLHHTGNILSTTGQSTDYPMSQKATTDALATKANTSTQVIAGTGLSGGGSLAANRTLSVNYGTTAGTAAQGNDSRIVNAVPNATQIIAGNGLSGGGNLTTNRTLTLGTPSTLTSTSTNSVSATSHTHELGADVKASLAKAETALQNGAYGLGKNLPAKVLDANHIADEAGVSTGLYPYLSNSGSTNVPHTYVYIFQIFYSSQGNCTQIAYGYNNPRTWIRYRFSGVWSPWQEHLVPESLLDSTGNSSVYPMTQKATTDALDLKQDKLTAGTNISISGNTISATNTTYTTGTLAQLQAGTDTTGRLQTAKLLNDWLNGKGYVTTDTKYSAGNGLTLSGTTFSLPVTVSGSGTYVQSVVQNANGITVTLGTPPNTNTTYSAGGGLTLSGTTFSLPVTVSGSGSYVQSVTQDTNGLSVTLGTPPNTTYSVASLSELNSGTATTARTVSAKNLGDWFKGRLAQSTGQSTELGISQKAISDQLLGVGQTWQKVSRVKNTNYTNTTNRAIAVSAKFGGDDSIATSEVLFVNGVVASHGFHSEYSSDPTLFAIVPAGAVYRFESNRGGLSVSELR